MGRLVRESTWIPTQAGSFARPRDVSLSELPDTFQKNDQLARQLGVRLPVALIADLAREVGVPTEAVEFFAKNPNAFQDFLRWRTQQRLPEPPAGPIAPPPPNVPPEIGPPTTGGQEGKADFDIKSESRRTRNGNTDQNHGSNSTPLADSSEAGRLAESWLRNQIRSAFGDVCVVSDAPVRDERGRETDILVDTASRQVHVEVKRLEGRTIYWSDLEASKAKDHPGNYYMALLRSVGSDDYSVHWLWNPLSELLNQQRRGVWLWPESRSEVPLENESWTRPEDRPERQAGSFSFRIDVSEQFILGKPEGMEVLRTRLQQ